MQSCPPTGLPDTPFAVQFEAMEQFLTIARQFVNGEPLNNIVDKKKGY